MQFLSILVCFSTLFPASLLTTVSAAKPKPVDLVFNCTKYFDVIQKYFLKDDVPIIFLHGLSVNKDSWRSIADVIALGTRKKVCAADLRNHGDSPWNDEEYDVIAMTEDVRHLIDTLKAPKAIVLGHSLGGKIALHLALNYPEKVEKLIVEDMRPNGLSPEALMEVHAYVRMLKELEEVIPQGVSESEAQAEFLALIRLNLAMMNTSLRGGDITVAPIKCSVQKCQLSVNPVLLDAILRNVSEVLNESSGRYDRQTLFIYGTESNFKVGEDESNIRRLFPKTKLVAVQGAGHSVHRHPQYPKEIIEFVNKK